MVTDLVQIRRLTEMDERENIDFRRFIKSHHYSESLFRQIGHSVECQIDCKSCANCCRETRVNVSLAEIDALARYLIVSRDQIIKQYTETDPGDHQTILRHTKNGCVFLDGNLCMVYEARPRACRDFPYVTSDARSLGGRMSSVCRHAPICPIVYNTLQEYKHAVGYHHG